MAEPTLPVILVTFPSSAEANALLASQPGDLKALYEDGIPRSFVSSRYRASEDLSVMRDERGHPVVRFGSTILDGSMALDPRNGGVVQLVGPSAKRLFVDGSLEAFTGVVQAVSRAFPFYPEGAPDQQIKAAAQRIGALIRRIDPAAMMPDRYWSTFLDDMLIGDLATDAVLQIVATDY